MDHLRDLRSSVATCDVGGSCDAPRCLPRHHDLERVRHDLEAPERAGRRSFFCTDAPERFQRVGRIFFNGDLSGVTLVDL